MIKGKLRPDIRAEILLKHISEYDIYRKYFGEFEINKATVNHLRYEKNPSFIIFQKDGKLLHWDFADSMWRGDCFSLVMMIYKCDFETAIKIIERDFGINYDYINLPPQKQVELPKLKKRRKKKIQVITRQFTTEELQYWKEYYINEEELKLNNIYSISQAYINKLPIDFKIKEIRFGYYYEGYWKIYRPNAEKDKKWLSNVPIDYIEGRKHINPSMPVVITKSKKDAMVIRKIYPFCISVQSENIACFTEENVRFIKENSTRQILSFDSDEPGVKNSIIITSKFGFEYCNVPKNYLSSGIKDWAELAKSCGIDLVKELIWRKLQS